MGDTPRHTTTHSRNQRDGSKSEATEYRGREPTGTWSQRFYEHALFTFVTVCVLVVTGPRLPFGYHSYVLDEALKNPSNALVAVLWLQTLVAVPLAWTVVVACCARWVGQAFVRAFVTKQNQGARGPVSDLLSWVCTCFIAAWAAAEIAVSGLMFGVDFVQAEARRRAVLEIMAMASAPMLFQVTSALLTTCIRRKRTVSREAPTQGADLGEH